MKKLMVLFVLVVLVTVEDCGKESQSGKIKGRIFRSDLNEPIPSVIIELWTLSSLTGRPILATKAKTNNDGMFTFEVTTPPETPFRLIFSLSFENLNETPCLSTKGFRDDGWKITTESLFSGGYLLIAQNKSFEMSNGKIWRQDIDICCK